MYFKKIIEKSESMKNKINDRYDISMLNIDEVIHYYKKPYDICCAIFAIGYMQGEKAAKAEFKKKRERMV